VQHYGAALVDAYGVLVDNSGPLAGAAEFIARLRDSGRQVRLVTNDASRLEHTIAARLGRFGIEMHADEVVSSGSLLESYFDDHGLSGATTMVLGPPDSLAYVRRAGGQIAPLATDTRCDVVAVCDEDGYPFLPTVDDVATAVIAMVEAGAAPRLVLPNPDLLYPKSAGGYGFTSGAAALLIEAAIGRRLPGCTLSFEELGKPEPALFARAAASVDGATAIAVGDQLETDIASACRAGLDTVLVTTGVSRWPKTNNDDGPIPTVVADSLI